MPTFDDLKTWAGTIPGIEESTSYGTPALKYRKKLVSRLLEDGVSVSIFAREHDVEALPKTDPDTFSVPKHYVGYGMLVINLATVRKAELEGLFRESAKIVQEKIELAKPKTKKVKAKQR